MPETVLIIPRRRGTADLNACMLGHNNPSIWTVIEMLQAATTLVKHQNGSLTRKRRLRTTEMSQSQRRLTRLCQEHVEKQRNMADFLRAVAYQIRFQ